MSDLEDSDVDIEQEDMDKGDSDKEEKELVSSKQISTKKLFTDNSDTDEEEEEDLDMEDDSEIIDDLLKEEPEYSDTTSKIADPSQISPINSDIESEDEDYLQKFDVEKRDKYINTYHPECFTANSVEIESLSQVKRDASGKIIDDNHRTNPFLTKYERTKILGQRAKQLNMGDKPYIAVPNNIMDGYLIATLELKEKKIPVIIRRPLPSGKSEYWKLVDLEIL